MCRRGEKKQGRGAHVRYLVQAGNETDSKGGGDGPEV